MKKIYVTILSTLSLSIVCAQNGQIQNGGFENWSNVNLYDYPTSWGNSNIDEYRGVPTILKSTDAQLGTYSAEIRAEEVGSQPDTLFGYIYHGNISPGGGPDGGIVYLNTFNQVRLQMKCDLPVGDTLYLLLMRFTGGVLTETILEPAAYGTVTNWTPKTINISSTAQTELFIGFVMGDPFSGIRPTPGSWARVDNIQLYNGGVQATNVPDPSFENWAVETVLEPNNWYTLNHLLSGLGIENANRSIDAYAGSYAIELETIQEAMFGDTINGVISIGFMDIDSPNPFAPIAYAATPTTFSGAYKYSPAIGDDATISIEFLQGGIPIGFHVETLSSAGTYTTFSSPLTISGTPDSMIMVINAGNFPGSVLKLDALAFSGGDVSIEEFELMTASIFPNPASDLLMVKAKGEYAVELINMYGQQCYHSENLDGVSSIDISSFTPGSYYVRIVNEGQTQTLKLIVQ